MALDYASTMKAADFLAINSMGKVPAIVHRGQVVTETAAICAYLADAFPDADLAPRADERAGYYRWLFFASGPVEAAITNRMLGATPTDQQRRSAGYGSYDMTVDSLERAVAAHPYIAGDRFTAADVYVGAQVMWGAQFGTLPRRDAFDAYIARTTGRDAFVRASAKDDALMPTAA